MAQWRCDIRISWRTQLFSLLTHGVLILLILISPWPEGFGPLWLVLLTLVVFQCIRSQKRIAAVQGELRLLATGASAGTAASGGWRKTVDAGLRHAADAAADGGQKRRRLWLASDCMSKEEWRHLRQLLLYPPVGDGEEA